MRFEADLRGDEHVLGAIASRLGQAEFDRLQLEGGFGAPNDFPIERLMALLQTRQFPQRDWYEYEWAIYECGFDALERCTPAMRALLSYTYLYCNKRKQWGISIDSDYYFVLIRTAQSERWLADVSLRFIEWLNDHVDSDEGYEDYFSLLSWVMLRRIRGDTSGPAFQAVIDALVAKAYTAETLSLLTVSDRNASSWLSLHRQLPAHLDAIRDQKVVTAIVGVDAARNSDASSRR